MRRTLLATLVILGLFSASLCGFAPLTRAGVQCPTAPVQTVVVRDCCDHVVVRAPRPGDRVFVQCRCAEKKSAATKGTAATKLDLLLSADAPLSVAASSRPSWQTPAFSAAFASRSVPPPTLPPAA